METPRHQQVSAVAGWAVSAAGVHLGMQRSGEAAEALQCEAEHGAAHRNASEAGPCGGLQT